MGIFIILGQYNARRRRQMHGMLASMIRVCGTIKKIWKIEIFGLSLYQQTKTKNIMTRFKVTMEELQKDGSVHTIEQTAVCSTRKQVIEWYGLNEPDIVSYKIEVEGEDI